MDIKKILTAEDLDIVFDKRAWGTFTQFAHNEPCNVKILEIFDGQRISLQKHFKRIELWVALDDGLAVELDGEKQILEKNKWILIPAEGEHRLSAPAKGGRILEVAFGDFAEDDEIRLEDDYGRGSPIKA